MGNTFQFQYPYWSRLIFTWWCDFNAGSTTHTVYVYHIFGAFSRLSSRSLFAGVEHDNLVFFYWFWKLRFAVLLHDDVMAAILSKKREHCHHHNFYWIFLKLDIYKPWLKTRFKFEFQHSRLKNIIQNGRLKIAFFIQNVRPNQKLLKMRRKCLTILILTHWLRICAYFVHLEHNFRLNNGLSLKQ